MKVALRTSLLAAALVASAPAVAVPITFIPVGPVSVGAFGNLNPSGSGTDEYTFSFPTRGQVNGFVGTVGVRFLRTDLDFTSILLNGTPLSISRILGAETATINIPSVLANQVQTLSVGYENAQRFSSYGGVLTFTSAGVVPEPSTWAMLILGFGVTGAAMRYRRRRTTVSFG